MAFIAPIPSEPIIPTSYMIRFTILKCMSCGSLARASEFMAVSYLKSRALGTPVKHMTACTKPEYDLPVERLFAGQRTLPYCAECPETDLSHLPLPPSAAGLYDLSEPTLKGLARKPAAAKAPQPRKPTIEDLA